MARKSAMRVAVYANCDLATIVWRPDGPIKDCRGFALQRKVSGADGVAKDGFINTWVGFVGGEHKPGQSEPSTTWPIQRFMWSDYAVTIGQTVSYRVIPMIGPANNLVQAPDAQCSGWTKPVTIGTGQTKGFSAYFNRGVVGSQFMARQAGTQAAFTKLLKNDITRPDGKLRAFLSGVLRIELLNLLAKAKTDGTAIYAALYELNDPEIIKALKALGAKCNLILGSGAFHGATKSKPAVADENADVRADLRSTKIQLSDRLVKGNHFAHNKTIVFCNKQGNPISVWTGSTNATITGLCTQTNNGLLIEDATIAAAYKTRWDALKAAESGYPKSLLEEGSTPAKHTLGKADITAWNAPCIGYVDLQDAKQYIAAAKQGVLYLMFNPGISKDPATKEPALIQDILALNPNKVLIQGVLNQDPGGKAAPLIQLTHNGTTLSPVSLPAILPKGLKHAVDGWFQDTYNYNLVMIHSKVIVIDPFGESPVVMTGSHNLGPKASASNDDNLVIVRNAPGLAAEYATYIANVYGHYKWMFNEFLRAQKASANAEDKKASPQYNGNHDDDRWQAGYFAGPNLQQMQFWLPDA